MDLAKFLQQKHLEYINQVGRGVTETEWLRDELNPRLPSGDKLSYASLNQWMNGDRKPDANNIIRLINVFGPEVMPYVGIEDRSGFMRLMRNWDDLSEEQRQEVINLIESLIDGAKLPA